MVSAVRDDNSHIRLCVGVAFLNCQKQAVKCDTLTELKNIWNVCLYLPQVDEACGHCQCCYRDLRGWDE